MYDPDSCQINLFQVTLAKKHNLVSNGVIAARALGLRLGLDHDLKIRIIVVLFGNVQIGYEVRKELYDNWGLQVYVVRVTEDQLYRI